MNDTEQNIDSAAIKKIWFLLEAVCDPEVPVLSILDLGIVRDVKINAGEVEVIITPTYSGCPAMDVIRDDVRAALSAAGFEHTEITTVLSPPSRTTPLPVRAIAL